MAVGVGDTVHIVELKRPDHVPNIDDFAQLTRYVAFVKDLLGNTPKSGYADVSGYLVVGRRPKDSSMRELIRMGEQSRKYLKTYEDLVVDAHRLHRDFEKKLEEFEKARLQARL